MNNKDWTYCILHGILSPEMASGVTTSAPELAHSLPAAAEDTQRRHQSAMQEGTQGSRWRNIFRIVILTSLWVGIVTSGADRLCANTITLGPITVDSLSTTGVSFGYVGTLTQNDTLELTVTGDPCLQTGPAYCINGAGVVTVAGTSGVGAASTFSGTFGGTNGTWDFGALLMEISGTSTVQVFPADAADGLGSGSPPLSLTLPLTTLSALGFPAFEEVNPTITFILADNLYTDNSGSFNLSQTPSQLPEPATVGLIGVPVCALAAAVRRRRAARNAY